MRLFIRNKWLTLRGSSYVRDEHEQDVLKVQGKFFTFTRKKFVKDLQGNVLYIVRNKFWYLFHRQAFVLDPSGKVKLAHLSKKIFTLHDHYNITTAEHGEVVVRGNILGYDYHIFENEKEIGHVSRMISLRDSFVLDIEEWADWQFYCAVVIAIDNIVDKLRSDASSSYSYSSNDN